ncbi:MAG: response regulator, partial [Leptolyngbya sp. Prado105]|nr:response regulator [Leptolyngbya sp. Prado105]
MARILLVEDNDVNREMLSRRLERKGYEVIVAINGAEGVAKTQSDKPDLVLMDLHLPILDGWEATRQIRANPETRNIAIVALTADANAGENEKALAAGCNEYETKPVDFARLLNKIAKLLAPPALQPAVVLSPKTLNLSADLSLQRLLRARLRRKLDSPIHNIIGYSDLLLEALSDPQNSALCSDIQKIHTSALQLLRLVQAILNPVLVDIQQQDFALNLFAPVLRRELLTPLSTIIGYCEILFEEAAADLIPDLEQIYTS